LETKELIKLVLGKQKVNRFDFLFEIKELSVHFIYYSFDIVGWVGYMAHIRVQLGPIYKRCYYY